MDSTDALFQIHRIPRQIEIEKNARVLEIDALTTSRSADQYSRSVRSLKTFLGGSLRAVVAAL
jgi:hypothetical protein